MTKLLQQILGFTCLIPSIVGLYKHKKIERKYHLFIYMVMLDFFIEVINFLIKYTFKSTFLSDVHLNIYLLIYFYLFMKLAYINNFISKKTRSTLLVFLLLVTIFNILINGNFIDFYRFAFGVSATIVLCIYTHILSVQVLEVNTKITKSFWFWVSSFSILYNAFLILLFSIVFFSFANTPSGRTILKIHYFVNAITYLFFAYAIYIIPEKINFNKPIQP